MSSAKEKAPKIKEKKESAKAKPARNGGEGQIAEDQRRSRYLSIGIVAVIAILVLAVIFLVVPQFVGVPFQTFKANFNSAHRVALAVTFSNQSQYVDTSPCYTALVEIIARNRNASSIGIYFINQTTSTCIYSSSGLGGSVNITTVNAATCIAFANSEPSIFLNYSASNYTRITPSQLYVGGDAAYLASCPIATEFS